jgi:L-alanine-DL-glutamate epimerase-like enolase superfamily enzyme
VEIAAVEATLVGVPLTQPFKTAHSTKDIQRSLVVVVHARDGCYGIGNVDPSPGYSKESVDAHFACVRDRFGPALLGLPAANVHRLLAVLDALDPAHLDAKAAIEMACLDLMARRAGLPLATLLGGTVREEIRFNAWIGMLEPAAAAREAAHWMNAGFRSCKVKVGGDVATDCARVRAVRQAAGPQFAIRADGNEGYSEADAIAFVEQSADVGLQLYEQPIPGDDLAAMARVRARANAVDVPLMADEAVLDHASLIAIIRAGAADIVKVKVMKQGGLLATRRMIATAEAAGLPCVIGHGFGLGVCTTAEMIVAATATNVLDGVECVGPLKTRDDIVTTRLELSNGWLPVPTGHGLGVELDRERLDRYRLDSARIS